MGYIYSEQDGNLIHVSNAYLIYNDEIYKLPRKCKGNNITTINGRVFIDGYEFKDGKFKRTLRALFHRLF